MTASVDLDPAEAEPGPALWRRAGQRLLAKTIGELAWEEVFAPEPEGAAWRLRLASGAVYRFAGWRNIWGQICIEPESLTRSAEGGDEAARDVFRFLADARAEIAMAPADLAWYHRELLTTLVVDQELLRRNRGRPAAQLIEQPSDDLQACLEGHPKAIPSKGRVGWGHDDLRAYAPEYGGRFQLCWIAVVGSPVRSGFAAEISQEALLASALGPEAQQGLQDRIAELGLRREDLLILPVHPWQWKKTVSLWFAPELAEGRIVFLGAFGDRFRAQASLRTLTNAERLVPYDIKLSLSILNTSCYRGIPGRYIAIGPRLSDWLAGVVAGDPVLSRGRRVRLLREVAGVQVPNRTFRLIEDLPYHYDEALGVIWRERAEAQLGPGERAIMLSALHHCDDRGEPLLAAYAAAAGMSAEAWLGRLFETVTLPLYHFLCRYGVGFIAHGQNITVILRDGVPAGVFLKDFQGDLDLVDQDFPELDGLPEEVRAVLPRKRPEVIIHDIQTAHFVTVLRFISSAAARAGVISEPAFYRLLAKVIRDYQAAHPELDARFRLFDLFQPTLPRVCINRVRFAIGYAESNARPLPAVGSALENPLHLGDPTRDGRGAEDFDHCGTKGTGTS